VSVYDAKSAAARAHGPKMVSCPSSSFPNIGYSDFAAAHHDQEAAIDEKNNGVFFLNSKLGYDDLDDGASTTLFLGEKTDRCLRSGLALGHAGHASQMVAR
jgi:hypothetical protein